MIQCQYHMKTQFFRLSKAERYYISGSDIAIARQFRLSTELYS
jgi:hypothetical protein